MGAQSSPHTPFLAPWRFLLLRRSCCPGDVAESGLKRRRTIGLKGGVEEGGDPIAVLADPKAASDEANPYTRRRVVLAWQSAERHAPGAQLRSTRVDSAEARCAQGSNTPSVLSAFRRLNAPHRRHRLHVSMHLLVLSAFRHERTCGQQHPDEVVSMHLLVLSAFRPHRTRRQDAMDPHTVSMHLLVLSAFRPEHRVCHDEDQGSLNAPSGAQCFPTSTR